MSLIHESLPAPRLREVRRIAVAAAPEVAWKHVRAVDLGEVGFAKALFALRGAPERLAARLRGRRVPSARRAGIDEITGPGTGFHLLAERPGAEVVVGAVGKFWEPQIVWAGIDAETFTTFDTPGFGKLAYNLAVDPREGGGSWVSIDLRVTATDEDAWRRFSRYWRLVGPFSRAIRLGLARRLQKALGVAVPDEALPMPGDEVIPEPQVHRTHARTIEAPPEDVWPWLAQMGCRRGGWYSYDRLDNAGCPSATEIIDELQRIDVGELIPMRPTGDDAFAVLRADPGVALVLGSPSLLGTTHEAPDAAPAFTATWAFALEPIGTDATRLRVRVRGAVREGTAPLVTAVTALAAHEIMERRQLRGIRWRAEGGAAGAPPRA